MLEIEVKDLKKYLEKAWSQKKPIFIWGAPGIGKSEAIKRFCKEKGIQFHNSKRLSQADRTDFEGLPYKSDGKMKMLQPDWIPQEGKGILFIDEMNHGTPTVQKAAYQLILERKSGNTELGEDWLVIAAGNRDKDGCGVYDMDTALENRFSLHIEVKPPQVEDWIDYMKEVKGKENTGVFGYLLFKPAKLFDLPDETGEPSWPSPRTWEMVLDMIEGEDLSNIRELAEGCVGDVAGLDLYNFLKLKEKVEFEDVLENPEKFKPLDEDIKYSVVVELVQKYRNNKKKYYDKLIDFFLEIKNSEDFCMMGLKLTTKLEGDKFIRKVVEDDRCDEIAQHIHDFSSKSI